MDFVRPVQAVIPGAQGRILAVMAETTGELNLRSIARLAGVSIAQASRILPALVDLGIVNRRDVPPSALFQFVPDNVGARAVSALADARRSVLAEIRDLTRELNPQPASVIVFGSFARGEADRNSDLDVVIVRTNDTGDDQQWFRSLAQFRARARGLTGNNVEVIDTTLAEVRRLLRSRKPLWLDIQRDGIVVFGQAIRDLRNPRIA